MLHKMSEVRKWSHSDMMNMSKEVFFRYYGYWYSEIFAEQKRQEKEEYKRKMEENKNKPKQWKSLK